MFLSKVLSSKAFLNKVLFSEVRPFERMLLTNTHVSSMQPSDFEIQVFSRCLSNLAAALLGAVVLV